MSACRICVGRKIVSVSRWKPVGHARETSWLVWVEIFFQLSCSVQDLRTILQSSLRSTSLHWSLGVLTSLVSLQPGFMTGCIAGWIRIAYISRWHRITGASGLVQLPELVHVRKPIGSVAEKIMPLTDWFIYFDCYYLFNCNLTQRKAILLLVKLKLNK